MTSLPLCDTIPQATLLGIPVQIRAKIFRLAGLSCPLTASGYYIVREIQLTRSTRNDGVCRCPLNTSMCHVFSNTCRHRALVFALMSINRQLHAEAVQIFYGEHWLVLDGADDGAITVLKRLRPSTLACICKFHLHYEYKDVVRADAGNNGAAISSQQIGDSFKNWQRLCSWLGAKHPRLDQVELIATYLPRNSETERHVLEFLKGFDSFSKLRSLRVNLGPRVTNAYPYNRWRAPLSQIQERVTNYKTHHVTPDRPFPFQQLPAEMQYQVLSFTGLISKEQPLAFDCRRFRQRRCCRRCNPASSTCYCNNHRSSSSTCICWQHAVPVALFATSRQMSFMARKMFFSKNSFTCMSILGRTDLSLNPRLAGATGFIRHLTIEKILSHIRTEAEYKALFAALKEIAHPMMSLNVRFGSQGPRDVDEFCSNLLGGVTPGLRKIMKVETCPFTRTGGVVWSIKFGAGFLSCLSE